MSTNIVQWIGAAYPLPRRVPETLMSPRMFRIFGLLAIALAAFGAQVKARGAASVGSPGEHHAAAGFQGTLDLLRAESDHAAG